MDIFLDSSKESFIIEIFAAITDIVSHKIVNLVHLSDKAMKVISQNN